MKPSVKWPAWLTVFCFLPFLFAVFFRSGTGILDRSSQVLQAKLQAGIVFAAVVWLIYATIYCLSRKRRLPANPQSEIRNPK